MPNLSDPRFAGLPAEAIVVSPLAVVPFPGSRRFGISPSDPSDPQATLPNAKDGTAIEGGLENVERRERQLWIMLGGLSLVLTLGMVLVVLPQLMEISSARPDKWYLPRLFLGLVGLMAFVNVYLTRQRHTLRGTREALLREREQRQIAEAAAVVDPLTQSFNRRYMDRMMEKELSRAMRMGTQIAFLMVDVDEFKSVNTRFGHIVGDTILREVADVLRKSVRASDTVVRYGGDEFLLILTEAVEPDVERVITRIENRVRVWNHSCDIDGYQMRLSCGWAMHQTGAPVSASLADADKKMYETKHLRRAEISAEA